MFSFCFYLITSVFNVRAQWKSQEELTLKMKYHQQANPSGILFVHFDKNIYTNNETVWFTAYLLNITASQINKHKVLSVALVRDADSLIVMQEKYLINGGISFGDMTLPDSMQTGNYHFQVTTNLVSKGIPELAFNQSVTIKTNIDPSFKAGIKLLKDGTADNTPHQAVISVLSNESRFLPKPAEINYKYGNTHKKAKTNASGEVIMSVAEQENISDHNLYVKVKYGKDSSFLSLPMPVTKKKARIGFYPEGGNLITDLPSQVAWEARDHQLSSITSKAILYQNDQVLDTVETNSRGIGRFMLVPQKGVTYSLRLLHSAFADSVYLLPKVLENGVTVLLPTAASKDTLNIVIFNTQPQLLALRIHNFKQTHIYDEIQFAAGRKMIRIPLNDVPKGLNTVTLSDSLGRPLSERMFFAHYNSKRKIEITTDKPQYGQREKVTLKLSLKKPDTIAFVSIACVQNNRISSKQATDIERYAYLEHELSALPMTLKGNGFSDQAYMEDILMVKGWRKYTWQDIAQVQVTDTLKTYDSLGFSLQITKFDKSLKKPVDIALLRNAGLSLSKSTEASDLAFKIEDLIMPSGTKMQAVVLGGNQSSYGIKVNDPYVDLNKSYTRFLKPSQPSIPSAVQNNSEMALKSNEKVLRLKEVKITNGPAEGINYSGRNACGDYVCMYNILNCQNHTFAAGNRAPIPGHIYMVNGIQTVYQKCEPELKKTFIAKINGIYTRKEFHVDSYADPLEPALRSTVYWNHGLVLSTSNQELSFYTGDIIGEFKVVVQGVTTDDVTHEQYVFEVKAK